MSKYLLDSNVFVSGSRQHYGFGFCPAFWEWLESKERTIWSIDPILDEINAFAEEDELRVWANTKAQSLFKQEGEIVQPHLARIAEWVVNGPRKYDRAGAARFLAKADPRLIAFAMAYDLTIVTHEVPAPNSKTKVQIPDVATQFGVKCIDTFAMLRAEKPRFVLQMPDRKPAH